MESYHVWKVGRNALAGVNGPLGPCVKNEAWVILIVMKWKRFSCNALAVVCLVAASSGPAFSQQPMTAQRRAQIDGLASRWPEVKARASRAQDALLARVAADPAFDAASYRSSLAEAWRLVEKMEESERGRAAVLNGRLHEEVAGGAITEGERTRRSNAVARLFQLRMLFAYGNLMPRILDESVTVDGRQVGRDYAGADWRLEFTEDEMRAVHPGYRAATGFPNGLLDGK